MKAKAVHVEPTVTLEMTLREAQVLRALAASVALVTTGVVARSVKDLAATLHDAGVAPMPNAKAPCWLGS